MGEFEADSNYCCGGARPAEEKGITLGQALQEAVLILRSIVEAPRLDAEVLLSFCLNLSREALYGDWHLEMAPSRLEVFRGLVGRRARREPVAYITGAKEFWGREFLVRPGVLIPRPDTELLVEEAVRLLKLSCPAGGGPESGPLLAADVGTGSGAIAVSLACAVPGLKVYATDISAPALQTAAENARRHGVAHRVRLIQGDLLDSLPGPGGLQGEPAEGFQGSLHSGAPQGGLHVICANLPYIPSGEVPYLMEDVRLYEPAAALDGGADGLELYRRLLPRAAGLLRRGGCLLMEIGPGQGERLRQAAGPGWHCIIKNDLGGRERLVLATRAY